MYPKTYCHFKRVGLSFEISAIFYYSNSLSMIYNNNAFRGKL